MIALLAIDPSINSLGWARFENEVLVGAGVVTAKATIAPVYLRAAAIAERLRLVVDTADQVWCEWPQIYQRGGGRTKGDPNDLLGLAAVCGAIAASEISTHFRAVTPAQWKGQLGKEQSHQRIRARLHAQELTLWPESLDARDAVGIGLYALGRLTRRRVYAGASTP